MNWQAYPHQDRNRDVQTRGLVSVVHILQRLAVLHPFDESNGLLKVVPLLASESELVALNRQLDLHLCRLYFLANLAAQVAVDPLLDVHNFT